MKYELDEIELEIFNYWNSLGIYPHNEPNCAIRLAIRRALNKYHQTDVIMQAMHNYSILYSYRSKGKCKLNEFLNRYIDEYLPNSEHWLNYKKYH